MLPACRLSVSPDRSTHDTTLPVHARRIDTDDADLVYVPLILEGAMSRVGLDVSVLAAAPLGGDLFLVLAHSYGEPVADVETLRTEVRSLSGEFRALVQVRLPRY